LYSQRATPTNETSAGYQGRLDDATRSSHDHSRANVIAALRLADRLAPGATIVTVMCGTGMKYLKSFGAMEAR
jgi:hypothetical protein